MDRPPSPPPIPLSNGDMFSGTALWVHHLLLPKACGSPQKHEGRKASSVPLTRIIGILTPSPASLIPACSCCFVCTPMVLIIWLLLLLLLLLLLQV